MGLTPFSTTTFRATQPSFVTQFVSVHATLKLVIFHRSQDLKIYAREDFRKCVTLPTQVLRTCVVEPLRRFMVYWTPLSLPQTLAYPDGNNETEKCCSQLSTYFNDPWDLGARGLSDCVEGSWRD
jgi:hypothetical protein